MISSLVHIRLRCFTKMMQRCDVSVWVSAFFSAQVGNHRAKTKYKKRHFGDVLRSAQLCGVLATVCLVSTLKSSKNGQCLWIRRPCSLRGHESGLSQTLARLICFHFSPLTWRILCWWPFSMKFSGYYQKHACQPTTWWQFTGCCDWWWGKYETRVLLFCQQRLAFFLFYICRSKSAPWLVIFSESNYEATS